MRNKTLKIQWVKLYRKNCAKNKIQKNQVFAKKVLHFLSHKYIIINVGRKRNIRDTIQPVLRKRGINEKLDRNSKEDNSTGY